jgi:hypothetical protein
MRARRFEGAAHQRIDAMGILRKLNPFRSHLQKDGLFRW